MKIDIYDFDKTVVPFDSGSSFILFCFVRHPYLIFLLPYYLIDAILLLLHIIKLETFKRHIFCVIRFINLEKNVKKFWDKHEKDVFDWFRAENRERPCAVISASPDFLLEDIQKRLGFEYLMCTRHDRKTGTLLGNNCRNVEKLRRYREFFDGQEVEVVNVYSDSLENDGPIFSLGQNCYHVRKGGRKEKFEYSDVFGQKQYDI